jgi:molybdopterin-guanine dinucleotide biosynthesis protein A
MIVGAILAGGLSSRMGTPKAHVRLRGRAMIAYPAAALRASATELAIVGDAEAARMLGAVALRDPPDLPFRGPLCGVLAALEWAHGLGADWVALAPCDTPMLGRDIVARLIAAAGEAACAAAATSRGPEALLSVWRPSLHAALRDAMRAQHPPVRDVLRAFGAALLRVPDEEAANVNTPEELAAAEAVLDCDG